MTDAIYSDQRKRVLREKFRIRQIMPAQPNTFAIYKNIPKDSERIGQSWSVPVVAWGVYEMWTVSGDKLSMTGALVHEVNQLIPADLLPTSSDPFNFDGIVIGNWVDVGEESRWTTIDPVFPGQVRAT